ncbi:MAG: hypothetical protein GWP19_06420 [Planctomycetia bacterium]|nr:hypothetical protein [Planctomycetia bacterium]
MTNTTLIPNKTLDDNNSTEIDNSKPKNVKKEIKSVSEPIQRSITKNNINLDEINEKWDELIEELSSERPSIGNVLSHCEVSKFTGNRLELKLINGNNFNLRTLEKNKIVIEKYFEKVYNTPLKAVFLMTKSKLPKKETDVEKNAIETNKTTEKLIELFDGEILN